MNRNQFQRTQESVALAAATSGQSLGYRNVVINGAMQVAQRGTSTASIAANGYFTADRYRAFFQGTAAGTWTQSIENDAPTGSGFRKSLKMLCTTAKTPLDTSSVLDIHQAIEGQNLQQFLKGTASAKQFSLTFWVKSNVTGTYVASLSDLDNTRTVSAQYTISASATWEKKTITFPADTTGAFDNDNNGSLRLQFYLVAGTQFSSGTLASTWQATTNANVAVGQTNVAAATNNYWQITGVQLEAGSVATPFEFEDYGTTLAKCQRYYQRFTASSAYGSFGTGMAGAATDVAAHHDFMVPMRATVGTIESANVAASDGVVAPLTPSAVYIAQTSSKGVLVGMTVTGATTNRPYYHLANNNAAGYIAFGAEL